VELHQSSIYLARYIRFKNITMNNNNMNKFIKARIIGARALQLSCGAESELKNKVKDSVELSYLEFSKSKIPLEVRKR